MSSSLQTMLNSLGVSVTRLVIDSRAIQPGDTFVAYSGEKSDGRRFIGQAIAQGANAVIYEKHVMKPLATRLSEQTTPAKSLVMSSAFCRLASPQKERAPPTPRHRPLSARAVSCKSFSVCSWY